MSTHAPPRDRTLAIYPMVEEHEAVGRVAAVYAALLDRMPMVPSLFKSLAVSPGYLDLAWQQAERMLDEEAFASAADHLAATATHHGEPHPDTQVRAALARFVGPLARMTLLAAGFRLALDGDLDASPAQPSTPGDGPPPGTLEGEVPAAWEVDAADTFGRIRAALATPIVNSIWRALAAAGQLDAAWAHLDSRTGRAFAGGDELRTAADTHARQLPWQVVANAAALEAVDLDDAAPGMRRVLEAYELTLPRVLALVGANRDA